jgi:hypothetical protein
MREAERVKDSEINFKNKKKFIFRACAENLRRVCL